MNDLTIKFFGVIGFLLISLWCILDSVVRIPADISRKVRQTLEMQSYSLDTIRVSGRDVFLSGTLPDSAGLENAIQLAGSVPGVRRVEYEFRVVPPVSKLSTVQQSLNKLLMNRGIEFQSQSDRILSESDSLLEQIVEILQRYPRTHIEIRGHTDATGSAVFNLNLSQHRADAVRQYLIAKGISPDRLIARGYGASQPVASNATPEGRKKNRRVEFIVLEDQ